MKDRQQIIPLTKKRKRKDRQQTTPLTKAEKEERETTDNTIDKRRERRKTDNRHQGYCLLSVFPLFRLLSMVLSVVSLSSNYDF
jgi:hypothetical protein